MKNRKSLLIGAMVTTGFVIAAMFGKDLFKKGGDMDTTNDHTDVIDEDLQEAYYDYLEDLEAGYYDRDPQDFE